MTTKYKILFMVELLHDYYSNKQCMDFNVVASEETALVLRNRKMLFKMVGNKLIVLAKVNNEGTDEDKPFINLSAEDKFLFYMRPNNPQFNIVTNMDVDKLKEGKRYYFTNLPQNNLDGELSLTEKIVQIPGVANYQPGDLTADGTGIVYECITSTDNTHNPPADLFWYARGKKQYVSARDMILAKTRIENFIVTTPAKEFAIKVFGLNLTNSQYDKEIPIIENIITTDVETFYVQIKLHELMPGRYKLNINTNEFDLFIDDAVVYNNVFGIIEIFSHLPNGSDFAFLDNNGKIKDKINGGTPEWLKYKIHFANRLAYWKYNTPLHGVLSIDGEGVYTFAPTPTGPGDKNYFTSNKPIPLQETPWQFKIDVEGISNTDGPLAPNPDPSLSSILSRTVTEKDYYCTINLNYKKPN